MQKSPPLRAGAEVEEGYSWPSSAKVSCRDLIRRFTSSGGISIQDVDTGRPDAVFAVCFRLINGFPSSTRVRMLVN